MVMGMAAAKAPITDTATFVPMVMVTGMTMATVMGQMVGMGTEMPTDSVMVTVTAMPTVTGLKTQTVTDAVMEHQHQIETGEDNGFKTSD
jgi:hypothetical protein